MTLTDRLQRNTQAHPRTELRDLPDDFTAAPENDDLNAAPGIRALPIDGALWLLTGLAIWFLAGCAAPPAVNQPQVSCLVDDMTIWLESHYADVPIVSEPTISFASQGQLQHMLGQAYASGHVVGLHSAGRIVLWDLNDMSTLEAQSTLVHELAHWIDFIEQRRFDHARVYAIQHAWEVAHWPDGVTAC